jgi:capsular exopolysaccharide synthesis family protein
VKKSSERIHPMSDSRNIQPYQQPGVPGNVPTGTIMTQHGPAVIQVIDMPAKDLALDYARPFTPRKPGGMNILSAVLRRWWLVLLMTVIIGGAGIVAGGMVNPTWEATAHVRFHDLSGSGDHGAVRNLVTSAESLITSHEIPLAAATQPAFRALYPGLRGINLDDPSVQRKAVADLNGVVFATDDVPFGEVVDIITNGQTICSSSKDLAEATVDAFAAAFVDYCKKYSVNQVNEQIGEVEKELSDCRALMSSYQHAKTALQGTDYEARAQQTSSILDQINKTTQDLEKARIEHQVAQNKVAEFDPSKPRPDQELERQTMIDEEVTKDSLLAAAKDEQLAAYKDLAEMRGKGYTDQHPQMVLAIKRLERAEDAVKKRRQEIETLVQDKIVKTQQLKDYSTAAKAKDALEIAEKMVKFYTEELSQLTKQTGKFYERKNQVELLEGEIAAMGKRIEALNMTLGTLQTTRFQSQLSGSFSVDGPGVAVKKEEKAVKVKAAGMVGGLFLGILLALLVDKFDKRLRDPRDLEPMLGVPLLGTIPRIQELKRIKGEQARNLIAEEFRVIRTQVLFGNPNLSQKIIAVTSPTPGDGKTSLAVNLAISIAKAGRRCLLVDGDLRKPDVHRVFSIPEDPGFAELIQGSHEPAAVIRKSEIDGLDLLPAGAPINRPAELLSRPDMRRILSALGELYDHIVLDTAPLLPVSDTHVLAGMVDGVICSFNAEVDRDTVTLTHEMLRRCHAKVIGTVMNQVKYKQSGSYQRGKSAYDSYYSRPRASKETALTPLSKP